MAINEPKKDPKNLVSQPPLTTPLLDQTGRASRAWAIWFRDLYVRTSYKGGNSIDNNLETLDDVIAQVLQNIEDIAANKEAIEKNAEDIAQNAADIAANTEAIIQNALAIAQNAGDIADNTAAIAQNIIDIAANAQNILNLEHRAFGDVRPPIYQASGVSYSIGDYVVDPSGDPQRYFKAKVAIADPAGPFNSSHWTEKSIRNSVTPDDLATELLVGLVKKMADIADAVDSSVNIATPDIGSAPATYDQAYTQSVTDLTNESKAAINQLASDLNDAIAVLNNLLAESKTSGQMTTP
jgi:methyl-accepting chemotaxis protein